ncbi:MAG: LptF/LptG family permease, partial [Bacteroidetes bacterium]
DNAKKKDRSAGKKEKPGAKTNSAPKKQKAPKATPQTSKKKTTQKKKKTPSDKSSKKSQSTGKKSKESKTRKPRQNKPFAQKIDKPLSEYHAFEELLPTEELPELYDKAKTFARSVSGQAESAIRTLERMRGSRVSHVFEFHSKFSMAVACIIFLFIGAPMGAIVRKGGFGWPLLISIVFFVLYIILTIYHKNIAERFVIDAALAAWRPCLFYVPIGFGLTWMAMRDAGGMDFVALADRLGQYVRKVLGIKTQGSSQLTDNQPIEK